MQWVARVNCALCALDHTDAAGSSMHPSLRLPTCRVCLALESEKLSADDLRSVVSSIRVISSLESLRWRLSVLRISHSSVCLSDMFLIVMLSAAFSLMRDSLLQRRVWILVWNSSMLSGNCSLSGWLLGCSLLFSGSLSRGESRRVDRSSSRRNISVR